VRFCVFVLKKNACDSHRDTVVFTIFPYRCPGTYSPVVCRYTITIVGGLSPKFHVTPLFVPFFHKPELWYDTQFLPSSTLHGRRRPGPLLLPMAGICPFRRNARIPPIMGDDGCSRFVVIRAGGKNTVLLPGRFEVFCCDTTIKPPGPLLPPSCNMPVPAQCTRSPHHG